VKLSDLIQASRRFASPDAIYSIGARTNHSAATAVSARLVGSLSLAPETLLIFDTKKQRTWLVAAPDGLACVIDRLEEAKPKRIWHIPSRSVFKQGTYVLQVRTEFYSATAGHVFIDDKKPRMYSLRLFTDNPIQERIRQLAGHIQLIS